MTQKLTIRGVKEAALKAYAEGRLLAQHPDPKKRMCAYTLAGLNDGKNYGCAIGVGLTDDTVQRVLAAVYLQVDGDAKTLNYVPFGVNFSDVLALIKRGIVEVSTEDLDMIVAIQRKHDLWCQKASGVRFPDSVNLKYDEVSEAEAAFLALLKAPDPVVAYVGEPTS
jgi:hypothetical protein